MNSNFAPGSNIRRFFILPMLLYYALKLQRAAVDYLKDYGLTYIGFAAGIVIGYLILN